MNPQANPALLIENRIARRRERIARWEKEAEKVEPTWGGGDEYRRFCEGMATAAREKKAQLEAELEHARGKLTHYRSDVIATFFLRPLLFLRNRWRWGHGRCPLCNRDIYSVFPYYMAGYPNCTVCKGETNTNLNVWKKHRAMGVPKRSDVVGVKE